MASILNNVNCNAVVGPWYIEPNDVLGDSLQYINNNTMYFTCLIDSLYSQLNSSYIQKLVAGDGIVLTPISDAYNTIKISAFRTVPKVYVYDTISQSVSSIIVTTPLAAPPWWCDLIGRNLYPGISLTQKPIIFQDVGVTTWRVPNNVNSVKVTVIGGGGGGGGSYWAGGPSNTHPPVYTGGNGGTGGVAVRVINVVPGENIAIAVGEGGNAGLAPFDGVGNRSPNNGGNGGNSSFGTHVVATGGRGGGKGSDGTSGRGGASGSPSGDITAVKYTRTQIQTNPRLKRRYGPTYQEVYGSAGGGAQGGAFNGGNNGFPGAAGAVIIEFVEPNTRRISQQITLSAQFTQYLQSVVAANTAVPMPNTYSIVDLPFSTRAVGSVMLPTGDIFVVGSTFRRNSNNLPGNPSYIYNPKTNVATNVSYPTDVEVGGAACGMADGRVFVLAQGPSKGKYGTIFDPVQQRFVPLPPSDVLKDFQYGSFYNCCMLPNGNIYLNPSGSFPAAIYDPINNICFTSTNAPSGAGLMCVPMRDGRVYRIPGTVGGSEAKNQVLNLAPGATVPANVGYIYDWRTNSFSKAGGIFPTTTDSGWSAGCTLADGRVFMAPNDSFANVGPKVYNPYTDQLEDHGDGTNWNLNAVDLNYAQSILLPNGNVLCVPGATVYHQGNVTQENADAVKGHGIIYNPYTKTVVKTIPQLKYFSGHGGVCLTENGNIIIISYANSTTGIDNQNFKSLRIPFVQNFDNNTLTSPFFRHGGY